MNLAHLDPTLTEGTESLWPMGIVAVILWMVVFTTILRKGNK